MRSAIDDTFEYYKDSGRCLMVDVALHRSQGVCVWSPEFVLMARPVDSCDDEARVVDPFVRYGVGVCDAWHVHFCAGDFKCLADVARFVAMFPFVSFQRCLHGSLRLHRVVSSRFIR